MGAIAHSGWSVGQSKWRDETANGEWGGEVKTQVMRRWRWRRQVDCIIIAIAALDGERADMLQHVVLIIGQPADHNLQSERGTGTNNAL